MKKILSLIIPLWVFTSTAIAQETRSQATSSLMGLGMPGSLATEVAGLATGLAVQSGSITFSTAGLGVRLPTYVPTMASTPVAGTNMFKVGLNVVPTAASNTEALLDATPTPGDVYYIYNSGPNTIKVKMGGVTTMNGAGAGGTLAIATLLSATCRITSASNANCVLEVAPTPAA